MRALLLSLLFLLGTEGGPQLRPCLGQRGCSCRLSGSGQCSLPTLPGQELFPVSSDWVDDEIKVLTLHPSFCSLIGDFSHLLHSLPSLHSLFISDEGCNKSCFKVPVRLSKHNLHSCPEEKPPGSFASSSSAPPPTSPSSLPISQGLTTSASTGLNSTLNPSKLDPKIIDFRVSKRTDP